MLEDSLPLSSITSNLKTNFIGQKVIYYPSLPSTMEIAKREARRGATEGTAIIADEQTAGKGRLERSWLSPKGSIAISIVLYPRLVYLPYLTMLASLAVVHSIEAVTDLRPKVKWPNDILINGKKVCGILIESQVSRNKVDYAIIGIGINVNLRISHFPQIQSIATSLSTELGSDISRLRLIRRLLVETERLYLALLMGESFFKEWRDSLVTLGKRVHVESGETIYEGFAESVAEDGTLLLRRQDGSLAELIAGDVTLRDYE